MRGDFDGDGRIDAAVFRPLKGIWYIRRSSNNQAIYKQWGAANDKRVGGDFDGDGRTDYAVYRGGVVYYILNAANFQSSVQQFGAATDKPVASAFVQ